MIRKFAYNTERYPLRNLFCRIQKQYDLENVHLLKGFENVGNVPGKDNNSDWHARFYNSMRGSEFMEVYKQFITVIIKPIFSEALVYQKYPTLRYQIPNGRGVAAYHIDSEYNHPIEEFNIWLPFTHAKDTRTIRIETEPGKKDYQPQDVKYGEFIIFEGGKLSHGNEPNTTGETRVSIDMRVIPLSMWKPSKMKGLAYGKVRDTEGEDPYYDIVH